MENNIQVKRISGKQYKHLKKEKQINESNTDEGNKMSKSPYEPVNLIIQVEMCCVFLVYSFLIYL